MKLKETKEEIKIDRRCKPFCNRKGVNNPNYKGGRKIKIKHWEIMGEGGMESIAIN